MKFKALIWIQILGMMIGCASFELEKQPPPSPIPIRVVITPELFHVFKESLNYCTSQNSGITIVLDVFTQRFFPTDKNADIYIQMGEQDIPKGFLAYQLGWEDIFLITHNETDIGSYDLDSIQYELIALKPNLEIWTYPEGNILRRIVEENILQDGIFSPNAKIASSPSEMVERISQEEKSLGYIPGYWLNENLKIITLDPTIQNKLRQPILALTHLEPNTYTHNFVACLLNFPK